MLKTSTQQSMSSDASTAINFDKNEQIAKTSP
jgi:hypothetical protein